MDKEQLTAYLKSAGRSNAAIERSLVALESFDQWLKEKHGQSIDDNIHLKMVQDFIQVVKKQQKNLLMGLANVFDYQEKDDLRNAALQMRRAMLDQEAKPMLLREFIKVDKAIIAALEAKGIRNAFQLLRESRTSEERNALASELGITLMALLDLVKMADLSRLFSVKAVRARLYLDSGYDTLDRLAAQDPMELHHALVKFVEESHFNGIATLPKEAEETIKSAKEIERWILFKEDE